MVTGDHYGKIGGKIGGKIRGKIGSKIRGNISGFVQDSCGHLNKWIVFAA